MQLSQTFWAPVIGPYRLIAFLLKETLARPSTIDNPGEPSGPCENRSPGIPA